MALSSTEKRTEKNLKLPNEVLGLGELRRLRNELEGVQQSLQQSRIRQPEGPAQSPEVGKLLKTLAADNGLDLLKVADQERIKKFLLDIEKSAPVVNISFAADPSTVFMTRIVEWFRTKAHPYTLIRLGLQPAITAGCIVRTSNKSFDLSLRSDFANKRQVLSDLLEAE